MFPVCKKIIIKLSPYNPMYRLVKISPTGLQFIGKSHFVVKKSTICCCICLECSLQVHSFLFCDDILQAKKQTEETRFSFFLQTKQR